MRGQGVNGINDPFGIQGGFDVLREIDEYEGVIQRFLAGELHPEKLKSYRLNFGTYGVRHYDEGMHMLRVKAPQGILLGNQARVLAEVIEKYAGSGVGHMTTREAIQLHYVKLEDVPAALRLINGCGLTTREACGNTVRNVTSSPLTGINPNEVFDTTPYALYTTRYFLRHPIGTSLPRKFKISFSESSEDYGLVGIHDIGAVAVTKEVGGELVKGFKVWAGGGLGYQPMAAILLTDFVTVEEFYPLAESLLRIFHRYGERKNRMKARMKFLVAKLGPEEFKRQVFESFEDLKKVRDVTEDLHNYLKGFVSPIPDDLDSDPGEPDLSDSAVADWFQRSGFKQKQTGYYAVFIRPVIGNLNPDQWRAIADLSEKFGAGYLRVTQRQELLLPFIKGKDVTEIYRELNRLGLTTPDIARELVSCPGAYSCKLAVTNPFSLSEAIGEEVDDLAGLKIHASGCPNACGHHHTGNIGFYGASVKAKDGRLVPHYILMLGGHAGDELAEFGQVMMKIPARNVPKSIKTLIGYYRENRNDGETFLDFVRSRDRDEFRKLLAPLTKYPTYEEDPSYYSDLGEEKEFKMEAAARGECAGSLIDQIVVNIFEGVRETYEAEDDLALGRLADVVSRSISGVGLAARALLFLEGEEFEDTQTILKEFAGRIVPKQYLSSEFDDIAGEVSEWESVAGDAIDRERAESILNRAKSFIYACDEAFLRLTPELKIRELAAAGSA